MDKDSDTVLTVKVSLKSAGTGSATADSGDEIQWSLADASAVSNGNVVATGASSTTDLTDSDVNIESSGTLTGDILHVRRGLISGLVGDDASTDEGTLLSSARSLDLFAFEVSATDDPDGDNTNDVVDLQKLKLAVSGGGDLSSSALSSVKIYRSDVPTTKVSASNASTTALTFNDISSLRNIQTGESATFIVEATTPTATYTTADTLQISLSSLGAQSTESTVDFTAGDLVWSDNKSSVDNTSWVGYEGITITDIKGPVFMGPSS